MGRNFGLGSRCIFTAGKFALKNAAEKKFISFQSAADIADRWRLFCNFAADNGVKQMEFVTEELVLQYGAMLAIKEDDGLLATSTAQNRVSAVNTVMKHATYGDWNSISPTAKSSRGCAISRRSNIRTKPPCGMDRDGLLENISDMDMNDIAMVMLIRDFGLRSKEASLINPEIALEQALRHGYVNIIKGTKGGRARRINEINLTQIETLKRAVAAQGARRNLIIGDQSWEEWRAGTLRDIRETLQNKNVSRLHELRAAYACGRYKMLTGHKAPVLGGNAPKVPDSWARLIIAEELGHGRIDVTNSYLGVLT